MPRSRRRLRKVPRLLEIPISVCYHDLLAYLSSSNDIVYSKTLVDPDRSTRDPPINREKNRVRRERSARGFSAGNRRSTIVAISGIAIDFQKRKRKRERGGEMEEKNGGVRGRSHRIRKLRISKVRSDRCGTTG